MRDDLRVLVVAFGLLLAARPAGAGITGTGVDAPTCVKLSANKCVITFNSVFASSDDGLLVFLRLSVADKVVANVTAWFENSVYVAGDRFGAGFPVACGTLGSGGNPALGAEYVLKIEPGTVSGVAFTDTANIFCPAK